MQFVDVARSAAMVATGLLGWTPEVFWRATPSELQLALNGRFGESQGRQALSRQELERLREALGDG